MLVTPGKTRIEALVSPAMRIKVGHNKLFGGIILGLGLANVVLAAMAGRGPSLFLGPLFVLIGILYLIMPAFVVADGCFQVKNLIGVTLRRYHFGSPREIEIEGSKIYLRRRDGTPIHILENVSLVPDARGPRQAVASSPINAEVHRRYPPSATDAKNSGKSSGLRKRKV